MDASQIFPNSFQSPKTVELWRNIFLEIIGAIARTLGMKISYKHYYEDDEIAIVPDILKENQYYQIYYKPTAVNKITKWFEKNRKEAEYKIICFCFPYTFFYNNDIIKAINSNLLLGLEEQCL